MSRTPRISRQDASPLPPDEPHRQLAFARPTDDQGRPHSHSPILEGAIEATFRVTKSTVRAGETINIHPGERAAPVPQRGGAHPAAAVPPLAHCPETSETTMATSRRWHDVPTADFRAGGSEVCPGERNGTKLQP